MQELTLIKKITDRMVRIAEDSELKRVLDRKIKNMVANYAAYLDRICILADADALSKREYKAIHGFVEYLASELLQTFFESRHKLVLELKSFYEVLANKPLPPYPTFATPGSKEKIEVLRSRLENGYSLFHPDDASCPDSVLNKFLSFCDYVRSKN